MASRISHDPFDRWTIPLCDQEAFFKAISPYTVDDLKMEKIEVVFSENIEKCSAIFFASCFTDRQRVLIWEDNDLGVYLPKTLINPCHLEVELKKKVTTFFEVSSEEMINIHRVIAKVTRAFQSLFGVCDYLVDFQHDCKKNNNHFVVKVVGAHPDYLKEFNLINHALALLDFFGVEIEIPKEFAIEKYNTSEYRERLISIFKEAIENKQPVRIEQIVDIENFSWTQRKIMAGSTHMLFTTALFTALVKQGISMKRVQLRDLSSFDKLEIVDKSGCAFCKVSNVQNIQDQTIYVDDLVRIMLNQTVYLPDGHYGHFLLTSKEHRTDFEDLTPSEIMKMQEMRQILVRVLVKKFGWKDFGYSLCQNGNLVGRSVPHVHYKIENNTDNIINWLLFCLTYDHVKKISVEEMKRVTKEIHDAIIEELDTKSLLTGTLD